MNALTKVRKYFPQVNKVVDAKKSVSITVTKRDAKIASKKDPQKCALARACVRQGIADGTLIHLGFSYLIKGEVATRYLTSEIVAREITSFDRHHDFAAGRNYKLSKVPYSAKLGVRQQRKNPTGTHGEKNGEGPKPIILPKHFTTRVRTAS